MSKRKKQFDRLEDFLEDNQSIFLKSIQKNADKDSWTDNFYNPLIQQTQEIFDNETEGQLAVDVYLKENDIVILAAIAGIDPNKLDISLHNDILTIRGERKMSEEVDEENYFYKECYWGKFSRSIILPVEVKGDEINATVKGGILQIILPKANPEKKIKIKVMDEED